MKNRAFKALSTVTVFFQSCADYFYCTYDVNQIKY